jgi:hypothetical protein
MQATQSPFAEVLPRLYELKDADPNPTHPDAYFHDFEARFENSSHVLDVFKKTERTFAPLDDEAWRDLKGRAALCLMLRGAGRGWQKLFDTFNEAKGYIYLQKVGCVDIAFIKRAKKQRRKTPDLRAIQNGAPVLCEVKTINVSEDEVARRLRVSQGEIFATDVPNQVTAEMLNKVHATVKHAITQLDGEDPQRAARRIVFTILNFDDWLGHFQADYIAQLDAHLLAHPIAGAELVFCPASNYFERHFTMRSATIAEI